MNFKQAEKRWKEEAFRAYQTNMAGTTYHIESRSTDKGFDYCVSQYVCGSKTAEYWPQYRGGIRYRHDLTTYGEEFLATNVA